MKAAVLVLMCLATTAHAQAPGETEPVPQPAAVDEKSPGAALGLSLGVTLIGYATYAAGLESHNDVITVTGALAGAIGPTTGHIYAGHTWNRGLATRLIGTGVATVGIVMLFQACPIFGNTCDHGQANAGAALAIGGSVVYVGGVIYEIATAGDAARRANAEARARRTSWTVAPMATRSGGGLSVAGAF